MRVDKLGTIVPFFLALYAVGCSDDPKPGPNPPTDSGTQMDTGNPPPDDGGPDAPQGDMRPCTGSTIANGTAMVTHDGVAYSYLVHVPPSYDGTKRTPLVINWHGSGSQGVEQQFYSGTNALSDEQGFIVVYPTSPDRSWATGSCCSMFIDGGNPNRDDPGFARTLVGEIAKNACIDEKRVYSMGMSNGGFMSHRLACESSDLFAAVVSVAGKMPIPNCQPPRAVPVMHFHGTADATVTYDTPVMSAEGTNVPDMMQRWADRNGCASTPQTTFQMGVVTCKTWSQCRGNVLVTLCSEEGVGHCWPGAGFCPGGLTSTNDISATREGWAFLRQFVLP